jgi:hypothetical protein
MTEHHGSPDATAADDAPDSATEPKLPTRTRRKRLGFPAPEDVTSAVDRGLDFLRSRQLPTGAWLAPEIFEPQTSAAHLLTLAFVDRVPLVEARGYARFLATLQREDGSFPAYPHAEGGDLAATALVYAALEVAKLDEHAGARARARAWVERNGGFEPVRDQLVATGDVTAVYLAMAGLVDPFTLPDPELSFILAPPLLDAMLKKMNAGVVATIVFIGAVTRMLRERKRPSTAALRTVHELEAQRCADFIEGWLNPSGNYCGTTTQTDMAIATLYALGRSPESPRLFTAIHWFDKHRVWDERGLHLQAFTNENWMTAWSLRALVAAGVRRDDPAIADGLDYLCWSQSKLPMPEVNLRRKNAHRTGAWGFQEDNFVLVDMDDTGIILSALGLCRDRRAEVSLEPARAQRVQDAIDLAVQNVLDMQCDDGGWAGFVWNLGSKQKGPLFDSPIAMPSTLGDRLRFLTDAPVELGEPAVEGLTGRVLQGLGANGFRARSIEVQRAAAFLRERQMPDGSWWERWIIGWITATASIVSGLAACGWDMSEPWVQRAIEYLLSKQNADGGWGETPAAYERPHEGIVCPSMPPLTAIVLVALVDAGLADHPAAGFAARYLVETQNDDGSWPTNGWLQIYLPYASYYLFEGEAWYRPVEALGKLRASRASARERASRKETTKPQARKDRAAANGATNAAANGAPAPRPLGELANRRTAASPWSAATLRAARALGDPAVDPVVGDLARSAGRESLGALLEGLTNGRELVPSRLPSGVRDLFDATSALPAWVDAAQIRRGQELFTRHGWIMAAGLFCSSLPQAYCAANGARVLTQTHNMTRNVRARVLETAQFLFDVCAEGSFEDARRGVVAAQRVRLVHALVRHFVASKGEWDERELGVPINQEDLAGTLMTFSVVLLDALETAGIPVAPDDAAAFLHLWNAVGHFLGVAPAFLPVDVADARAMMQVIRDDQWAPSVQGRLLAGELVASMREYLPTKLLADLPVALIRFFSPAPVPKLLALDSPGSLDRLLGAGLKLGSVLGRAASEEGRRTMIRRFSHDLMVGMIRVQRGDRGSTLEIPSALARAWKLGTGA